MKVTSEMLWNEFNKELQRFIISKVKDKDISNDILQDVFMKIHLKIDTLKDPVHAKQWAYQITRNTVNDHFWKQKFAIDIDTLDIPEEIDLNNSTYQFYNCLKSFITQLPQKYKEAITLTELQNVDQLSLAKRLKISYSGAKSRVQRGREILRKKFYACCPVSIDKYGNVVSFMQKSNCGICAL